MRSVVGERRMIDKERKMLKPTQVVDYECVLVMHSGKNGLSG